MVYNSFNFIILYPVLFLLYYLIPAKYRVWRNFYLLAVSYLLYVNWKPVYALILLGVTIVTFYAAKLIEKGINRKLIIALGGAISVIPLLVFKYYNFINESIFSLLSLIGLRFQLPGLNWAIPVGISFFTFQALGYLFDVYYKRIKAEADFLTYALFVSFFPSIMAGPINKASLVLPQFKTMRPYFDYSKAVEGLKMLLWGMFMKVVVADRLALYVDTVFPNYTHYTGVTCFVASILYTIQIYADFAGYSLMALGVGKTLGFELTENFRRPYFAISITDFWRRWHISFSTWLKDYIYIPLGGSRCSKIRNYWNIFITFLVSGIWHGANWTFIVWGVWHGLVQIIEKAIGQQKCEYGVFGRLIKIIVTFLLINFAWVFFRMPSIKDGVGMIERMFDSSLPQTLFIPKEGKTGIVLYGMGILMLFLKDFFDEYYPSKLQLFDNKNIVIRWGAYVSVMVIILLTGVFGADQFIYVSF